jgi:hypothetical protein
MLSSQYHLIGIFIRWLLLLTLLVVSGCSSAKHTVEVAKPRYHKTWYKKHTWHKKIAVGRARVRWFERQGVKKVKMRG